MATQHQLIAAGIASEAVFPARPWLRIQGTGDASTMWYSVMRKREKGIFIGTLALRHSTHHASLLAGGWEDVPIAEIAAPAP